jgi:hypothetical protein
MFSTKTGSITNGTYSVESVSITGERIVVLVPKVTAGYEYIEAAKSEGMKGAADHRFAPTRATTARVGGSVSAGGIMKKSAFPATMKEVIAMMKRAHTRLSAELGNRN